MHLTRFTELSLRVLIYLSQNSKSELIKTAEIAEQFDLPRNHLIKVVNCLVKLGWVSTVRGRSGGLYLAAQPKSLRLGDIIQATEGRNALINCNKPPCSLHSCCSVHGVVNNALDSFYTELNKYTLADMLNKQIKSKVVELHTQHIALANV